MALVPLERSFRPPTAALPVKLPSAPPKSQGLDAFFWTEERNICLFLFVLSNYLCFNPWGKCNSETFGQIWPLKRCKMGLGLKKADFALGFNKQNPTYIEFYWKSGIITEIRE